MEDYDFKYRYGNRFAFLGNGTVKAMVTKDITGLSPYVRNADTEWDIEQFTALEGYPAPQLM